MNDPAAARSDESITSGSARRPSPATETLALRTDGAGLRQALAFTEVHRGLHDLSLAAREAACLAAQFPAILLPIEDADLLAGRYRHAPVGFSPEPGGFGYYCDAGALIEAAETAGSSGAREAAADAIAYWRGRTTTERVRAAYPPALARLLPSDDWCGDAGVAFPLYRLAGVFLDLGRLATHGIPGLHEDIAKAGARGANPEWVTGMARALDVVAACCRHYAEQAREQASSAPPARASELAAMAETLDHVSGSPPETLRQALQLAWIYTLVAGVNNYGRMDVAFGPLLARDLDSGRLGEDEALSLLESLWRLAAARQTVYNGRIVIGGRGRRDPGTADRFARLALEATLRINEIEPQLTLRFDRDTDPSLLERAYDVIGAGRTFPMLYNDDVNVPAVERAFRVSRGEAEQYVPLGCGEYVLEHRSLGTPNGVVNLLKALEEAIHGTPHPVTGDPIPGLEACEDFEDLWAAYRARLEPRIEALAHQEALGYRVLATEAPMLLPGLLHDDCLARGLPLLEGGARYVGGTLETYGNISTADSLLAIQEVVYRRKQVTPARLREALAADFEDFGHARRLLRAVPKYGNDADDADAMAARVHEHVCRATAAQAERVGLDSYLVVIINNHANSVLGRHTGASADGRRAGEPMSNANNPSSGNDRTGVTAFLRSLLRLDPSIHAGAVQNMKFGRDMFGPLRPQLEALLGTYFDEGGAQAMITVVARKDLEAAMREPEKWGHLMVRVGGFSARFVDLSPVVQREILERTLH